MTLKAESFQQALDNGFLNKQGDRIIGDTSGSSSTVNLDNSTLTAKPNQNATIKLGDSSGATSFVIQNSNGIDIASLNSFGNFGLDGKIICANCIALGSETSGNYVKSLIAGSDIAISNASGEGAIPTIFNISTLDSVTGRGAATNHALAINSSGNALTFSDPNAILAFNSGAGRLYDSSGNLYYNSVNLTAGGSLPAGTSGQTLYNNGTFWSIASNLYNNGTNVGINTTSPSTTLDVNGVAQAHIQDKGGEVYNVKAYGAKGDGVTDDTMAIQAAVTAIPANGGTLYFPPGSYVTDTFQLPQYPKTLKIIGASETATILIPLHANSPLFIGNLVTPNIGEAAHVIEYFTFMAHASGSTGAAVNMDGMYRTLFSHITYKRNGSGQYAILFLMDDAASYGYCYDNVMEYVSVINQDGPATVVKVLNTANLQFFDHFRIVSNPNGITKVFDLPLTAQLFVISNGHFEGNSVATIVTATTKTKLYGNYYEANMVDLAASPDPATLGGFWNDGMSPYIITSEHDHDSTFGINQGDVVRWSLINKATTGNFGIQNGSTGLNALSIQKTTNNVGIGTNDPDRVLDVLSTSNPQLRLTYTDGSVYTDFKTTSSGGLTIIPSATASGLNIASANTTGTGTNASLSISGNSLTSGTGLYTASSTLSSGSLIDVAVTGTASANNTQKALNISTSGANATSTQTTYGGYISNTHTGTSSTNVGLYATASGATNNYAAIFNGGSVGIGTTTPTQELSIWGGNEDIANATTLGSETLTNPNFNATGTVATTLDSATDFFTSTAHGLSNDNRVHFSAAVLPTELSSTVLYYVINKTTDTFQVSTTSGGAPVDFSNNGTTVVWANDWTPTNDATFDLSGTQATWSYSAGTASTLTQAAGKLATTRQSSRWYKFTYTVSGVSGTPSASITTAFASATTALTLTAGAQTTYFQSATSPTNFVINSTLTAGQAFTLDSISLKEVQGGNLSLGGLLTGGGTSGIKVSGAGKVGIGTATPVYDLEVVSASAARVNIDSQNTSNGGLRVVASTAANSPYASFFLQGIGSTPYLEIGAGTNIGGLNTTFPNSNLGIKTAAGVASQAISIGGTVARTIWMERNTTADTAGNSLTLQAGGATSGATDKNGGGLILSSGTATGAGSSTISFQTGTAGGAGTTDRSPSTKMTILGSGNIGIGETSPTAALLHLSTGENYGAAYGIQFGSTNPANLYRSAASILTTDSKLDPASLNLQVKAGIPVDGDIVGGAASGDIVLDTLDSRIYVREGAVWKYTAIIAGFQIPTAETYAYDFSSKSFDISKPIKEGDLLIPFADKTMSDGAMHGLYTTFDSVKQTMFDSFATDFNQLANTYLSKRSDTALTKIVNMELKLNDLTTRIDALSADASFAAILKSYFVIDNNQNLTLSANLNLSGSLTTSGLTIENKNNQNKTIGQATIPAGQTSVIIPSQSITENSRIFVTPRTKSDQVLSATETITGQSFKVEISKPLENDVLFDWWIVEEK